MLSYIVGGLVALIFVVNPISQMLFTRPASEQRLARPHLNGSLIALESPNDTTLACPRDTYGVRILRREPLVVYLEGFLSDEERKHLLEISEPLFEPSTITDDGHETHRDATVRDSHVALLPRTDAVRCIEARARAFQGWREDVWIERLRTQRYTPGGHYSHHFDWSANRGGWGRVSSFMAWVDADTLQGGGTEFPLVQRREHGDWCRLVECPAPPEAPSSVEGAEPRHQGTVFRAVPGNAVYWENFDSDGRGYEETWHAGLPVEKGVKVGLNIWSFGRIEQA